MPAPFSRRSSQEAPFLALDDYVVLVFETTGRDPSTDKIIEVGLLRVRDRVPVKKMNTFINPRKPLAQAVMDQTGITQETLSKSPAISRMMPRIETFIGDDTLVVYNARFTMGFLREMGSRYLGREVSPEYIDIAQMSREIFPKNDGHRLSDLVRRFGVADEVTYQALTDAVSIHKCYEYLVDYSRLENRAADEEAQKGLLSQSYLTYDPEEEDPSFDLQKYIELGKKFVSGTLVPAARKLTGEKRWLLPVIGAVAVVGIMSLFGRGGEAPPDDALVPQTVATQTVEADPDATDDPVAALLAIGNGALEVDTETPPPAPTPTREIPTFVTARFLREGDKSDDVLALQYRLTTLNYFDGVLDGEFGRGTKSAVRAFQENNGLAADGIAGEKTLNLLFSHDAKAAPRSPVATNSPAAASVWVAAQGGTRYHVTSVCAGVEYPSRITLEEAQKKYKPCDACYK